jgi:hypothetical protein
MLLPGSPFDMNIFYVDRDPSLNATENQLMKLALRALNNQAPTKQAFIDLFEVELDTLRMSGCRREVKVNIIYIHIHALYILDFFCGRQQYVQYS